MRVQSISYNHIKEEQVVVLMSQEEYQHVCFLIEAEKLADKPNPYLDKVGIACTEGSCGCNSTGATVIARGKSK